MLLFSAARSQLIAEKVKPLRTTKAVIILDRFYDSTVAYQGYGRRSVPLEQVHQLNHIASHGLIPDITFYLRLDLEVAEKRRSLFDKDRMERSGPDFYRAVISGFDDLASTNPRIITIQADDEMSTIHQQIWRMVEQKIRLG
jgi:dTMP kinase